MPAIGEQTGRKYVMKLLQRLTSLTLALLMLLSLVYISPATQANAATTTYAANLRVKTTQVTGLVTSTSASASAKYTLPADTTLTATELYLADGIYWYKVTYYGNTLYIKAADTTMVAHVTADVTASNLLSPSALGYGQGFPLTGSISSTLNTLGTVTAAVHYNHKIDAAPAIFSTDTINGMSYTIDGSNLDYNLIFSDLVGGSYTYMLTVEAISYYIDDNDALATSTTTVVLENKPLIVTNSSSPNKVVAKGIDVSTYQGNINWATVATQVDFAILRVGYATTMDDKFTRNAEGCTANNVPFGVYLYSYAENESEAISEANFVINAVKNYDLDLPIFFDIEDSVQSSLTTAQRQAITKTFCETIKEAGYQPGVYTFLSWFNSYFNTSYFNSMPKWVAQISSSCTYAKGVTMWQYSWTGSFSGISGDVDCNYYYGEFPGKNTDTSYLASCTYYPSNLTVSTTGSVTLRQYPASSYSSLKTISTGTSLHVTGLYKNTSGEYWYQIDADGTTGYIPAGSATVQEYLYDDISVTDPTIDDLALKSGYLLEGKLNAVYNRLQTVHAKVYDGEDITAAPVLKSSASPNEKQYNLFRSPVCDNLIFSDLPVGYYTYEISADVKNYAVSNGSLTNQSKNVVLWAAPFTVGGATITPPDNVVCDHNIVTDAAVAATCTATGLTEGSHCSKCSAVFTQQTVIPATGHSYTATKQAATCIDYEKTVYTCAGCGDSYSIYTHEQLSQWSETKPEGVDESKLESKMQYRYSDYEEFTSFTQNLADYTLLGQEWVQTDSGTNTYVTGWPEGFDTSNSFYTTYNDSAITPVETSTERTAIESNELVGYLFYHWCRGDYEEGPINRATSTTQDTTFDTFHAFLGTTDPTVLTSASDGSVTIPNSECCKDTYWYYYIPVYKQTYTKHQVQYTYARWTEFTEWSDATVTPSDTRKVETRILYRYTDAQLGDHSYVNNVCQFCGGKNILPTITPKYPSVSFEGEVFINVYYTVADLGDIPAEDMGLLVWSTARPAGTIETAESVVPGATTDASGLYKVHTNGIPAKNLGDTLYFKIYIKLSDGSYVYSSMFSTSAKAYALDRIANSSNQKMRALCVAMLNYGAAAQTHFNYKAYDLMNASLTAEQKSLVTGYNANMVATLTTVSGAKSVKFPYSGFKSRYPSVSFDGIFSINYYFTPSYTMDGDMTLYYWDLNTYANCTVLTPENATGSVIMDATDAGSYKGTVANIAAKEIDQTIFVAGVYTSGGTTYTTGVLPYSLGAYCVDRATNATGTMQPFAAATAVYGYYAKAYFA